MLNDFILSVIYYILFVKIVFATNFILNPSILSTLNIPNYKLIILWQLISKVHSIQGADPRFSIDNRIYKSKKLWNLI